MIYCNVMGGLGNMLFQIAATKAYAIDEGVDASFPNLISQMKLVNDDNLHNPLIKHGFEYEVILKSLNREAPINAKTITFPFEYIDHKVNDNSIIHGFFQSEKYFKRHRDEILEMFKIPEIIQNVITDKYSHLLNGRTTSIHVRRGDYLKFPNHHPVQTLEYYLSAVDLVKDKTDKFLVFSDDIPWCKDNFKFDNIIYIEDEKDYIEIYLMSLCDNNITSNSSFGWWGAWLNRNNDKVVVGPNKWFGPAIKHETSDIIPESWIKL